MHGYRDLRPSHPVWASRTRHETQQTKVRRSKHRGCRPSGLKLSMSRGGGSIADEGSFDLGQIFFAAVNLSQLFRLGKLFENFTNVRSRRDPGYLPAILRNALLQFSVALAQLKKAYSATRWGQHVKLYVTLRDPSGRRPGSSHFLGRSPWPAPLNHVELGIARTDLPVSTLINTGLPTLCRASPVGLGHSLIMA